MAFAERAELIARLSLQDNFSRPLQGMQSKLSGFGAAAAKTGRVIGVGLAAGATVGAAVIGRAISSGLHSLDELENATTSVDAAITQMGLTGQITSGQIAQWANEIEKSVGAAFDDKAITQAATTLIRYGKITTTNLRPALVVMTDLAAKTGSVESAATLLAKALADPAAASGKLARQGVILTDVEKKQIKALTDAGKLTEAQTILLNALTKSTKGAAEASQGTYARSLSTLRDVTEDAQRALAEGFLPIIEKVRDILSTELAKPQMLQNIREFGKGLAGGLDSLVEIARKLPWGSIGDALKLGGAGAKIILDAFTSMPPWVQTAIATGWGLNKLTGGAVSGLIGSLASGLIKGVLGMTAGVVNINAAVVNGAGGGIPGAAAGGGAAAAGGGAGLGLVTGGLALIGVAGVELLIADAIGKGLRSAVQGGSDAPLTENHVVAEIGPVQFGVFQSLKQEMENNRKASQDVAKNTSGSPTDRDERANAAATQAAIRANQVAIAAAQHTARDDIVGAVRGGAGRTVSAIDRNRPIVHVNVTTNVTTGSIARAIKIHKTYSGGTIGGGHTGGQQEFG